jgi:hypothetical protein
MKERKMMSDRENMQSRVTAGAALLDEHFGNWRERIHLDVLKMRSQCRCVLGQLTHRYGDGLVCLKLNYGKAWQYGFDLSEEECDDVDNTGIAYAWTELDELWLEEIGGGRS